ncbi:hypothetical protein NQ314_015969 [Rhamnusium bicolor]|uniref:Uncharacterized protein n=1 Tax=Rhamnusium bicolor TaxID=1586634 RepID=A0AAV8WY42_9CUCU|nr:hypothetical protein NQ314_015969 [Rhamnusium bicolor]
MEDPERMFAYFRNSELGIIALALDEEEEKVEKRRQKRGRRKSVHSTWKTRPVQGEFLDAVSSSHGR